MYEAQVYDEFVIAGNTAVMKCQIPSFVADYIIVTSWLRDESFTIYPSYDTVEGKYFVLPTGELQIQDVRATDGFFTYRCRTRHQLTGDVRLSNTAGRLFVTEPHGTVPPRIAESKIMVTVKEGETAVLPCSAQAFPVPTYSWYQRSEDGRTVPFPVGIGRILRAGGNLIIKAVEIRDRGAFVCIVQNPVGSERVEVYLGITATLSAAIKPVQLQVDIGQQAIFQCEVSGYPISSLVWLKDGRAIGSDLTISVSQDVLRISSVTKKHRGIYQCIVNNDMDCVQASAELRLGDIPPSIIYLSSKDASFPNQQVSLKCIASGSPSPQITWTLDENPLPNHERFSVKSFSNDDGNIVSYMNISQVQTRDGGRFGCVAANKVGTAKQFSRLDVYGPPFIRPMPRKNVVAGENVVIHCPYGGHPIDFIMWEKGGLRLPVNHLQVAFPNGTLKLQSVQRTEDAGTYTCIVHNKLGQTAQQHLELMVLVPPKINPSSFQDTRLHEGSHARIICAVVEGDLPIAFTWLKERRAIPSELGIAIRDFDEFSSVLTISKASPDHGGNYTCVARNAAATDSYTALITVNVSPYIIPFSFQGDFLFENSLARVACIVSQGDLPLSITWKKDGGHLAPELGVTVRDFDEHSSVLTINRVTSRHNGNYTCIAQNPAGSVTYTAQLIVKVPPRWTVEPQDVTTFPRMRTVVDCQANGFPTPNIKWLKAVEQSPGEYEEVHSSDFSIHQLENGSLVLESAKEEHDGRYLCRASNGVGNGLSKVVNVDVQVPVSFDIKVQNLTVLKGEDARLLCTVKGDRPVRISWSRYQERLMPSTDPRLSVLETPFDGKMTSELTMKDVQRADSSIFFCSAENPYGKDESQINLIVVEPAEPPKDLILVDHLSRSITISWNNGYNGNSPVKQFVIQLKKSSDSWQRSQNTTVSSNELTATIQDLHPAVTYQCRVYAVNAAGVSKPSKPLTFTTLEEAPGGPPQLVKSEVRDNELVKITWKPPKKELWNGNIRGYYVGYKIYDSSEPYSFLTVEVGDSFAEDLGINLEDLRPFTKYSIVVQAFNHIGTSPRSDEIIVLTSEDVPSLPPQNVRCSALSGHSLQVTWEPVLPSTVNGILQGYRVICRTEDEWYEDSRIQAKVTSSVSTVLSGLLKYTNYSIQVLAFTRMGDGPRSSPVYCATHEDVPESPSDIKVVVTSLDSVIVTWKPPSRPNGLLKKYTIYMRGIEHGKEDIVKQAVAPSETTFEATSLKKSRRYEFWVTASTVVGEGQSTPVVSVSTSGPVVPAKLISFGGITNAPWKTSIELPCKAVGIPPPEREWKFQSKVVLNTDLVFIQSDGSLHFKQVQISDGGNYSCQVTNTFGSDAIVHILNIQVPPKAPILRVSSSTSTTLEVNWILNEKLKIPLQGFYLYYKREFGEYVEIFLGAEYDRYLITKLECGTKYQIYIAAVNKLGIGEPSEVTTTKTNGDAPIQPLKKAFIREDITFVTLLLETWASGGCPVLYFVVHYRKLSHNSWKLVSNNVLLQQKEFLLPDLNPATWYALRVIAHNNAGSTIADYEFATRTVTGGTVSPLGTMERSTNITPFYSDFRFVLTILICTLLIIIAVSIIFVCMNRRRQFRQNKTESSPKGDRESSSRLKNDCEKYSSAGSFSVLFGNTNKILSKNSGHEFSMKAADNVAAYATAQIPNCENKEMMTFKQNAAPQVYPHVALRTNVREGTYPRSRRQTTQQLQQCARGDCTYTEYSTPIINSDTLNSNRQQHHLSHPWLLRPTAPSAYDQHVPDLLEHGHESSTSNETSPDIHSLETPLRQSGRRINISEESGIANQSGINPEKRTEETTFIFDHSDAKDIGYEEEEISDAECDRTIFKSNVIRFDQSPPSRSNPSPLFQSKLRNYYDDNTIAV